MFPPLGIAAIWSTKWSKIWKLSTSVIAAIWMLVLYAGGPPEKTPEPTRTSSEVEQAAEAPVEITPDEDLRSPSQVSTSWDEVLKLILS